MKEIVVLSGSAGTGKTAVAASLAILVQGKVMVDCDTEAGCLTRLLKPAVKEKQTLSNAQVAVLDEEICNQCGQCERVCRFGAIQDVINNCQISAVACIGCGFCFNVCPEGAITLQEIESGYVFSSRTEYGPLIHADLAILQENSGQLISLARQKAKQIARQENLKWIIGDGPPGLGSPVLSSLFETSLAVLVVEPVLTAISDLEYLLAACGRFKVPAVVCLNQYDINAGNTAKIESFCAEHGIKIAARFPFADAFTGAILHGLPVKEDEQVHTSPEMATLWESITAILNQPKMN